MDSVDCRAYSNASKSKCIAEPSSRASWVEWVIQLDLENLQWRHSFSMLFMLSWFAMGEYSAISCTMTAGKIL